MKRTTLAAGLALALLAAPAYQAIANATGPADPYGVSAAAYPHVADAACGFSYEDHGDGGYIEIQVCAGESDVNLAVSQDEGEVTGPENTPQAWVYFDVARCRSFYDCSYQFGWEHLDSSDHFEVSTTLDSARLIAEVGGCQLNLTFATPDLPSVGRFESDHAGADGSARLAATSTRNVQANRSGNLVGTICDHTVDPIASQASTHRGAQLQLMVGGRADAPAA